MALSVFASSNMADGALTGWVNPTYAYDDDGVNFATRTGTVKNIWYGTLFGFDLSTIPDGATINSMTLSVEWKNSANDSSGPVLYLGAKSEGSEVGTADTDTTGQISFEVLSHAVTGLTAAQLKATGANGFWAILRFRRTDNTAHTASVDYVKCVVDYTPPAIQLEIQDVVQGQAVDSPSMTKTNILIIQDVSQGQAVESLLLTQQGSLAINDVTQTPNVENISLTLNKLLEIQDVAQGQNIESPSLTKTNNLTIADAIQGQAVENISLTAKYLLVIQNASQSQLVSDVELTTPEAGNVQLEIADVVQGQIVENIELIRNYTLDIQDAIQGQMADMIAFANPVDESIRLTLWNRTKSMTLASRKFELNLAERTRRLTIRERP